MSKIQELKQDIAARQAELDKLLSMGREGANARIAELVQVVKDSTKEIEELAGTFGIVVEGGKLERDSETFFPNKEEFEKYYSYPYDESEVGSYRKLPAWISSSELC